MVGRSSPCSCGSGKRYKHCCGALNAAPIAPPEAFEADPALYTDRGAFREEYRGLDGMAPYCTSEPAGSTGAIDPVPPGIMIADQYLSEAECERLCGILDAQESSPATVQDLSDRRPGAPPKFRLDDQRVTDNVPMGPLSMEIPEMLSSAYREVVGPFFGKTLAWMSKPAVLRYYEGGKYNGHADSEFWNETDGRWVRSLDRDYSVLLYLNEDYEGGTLYFPNFDFRLKPGRGMLVAFPSDHRYLHAAEPLLTGTRYAVVAWAAAKGIPKINPTPVDSFQL